VINGDHYFYAPPLLLTPFKMFIYCPQVVGDIGEGCFKSDLPYGIYTIYRIFNSNIRYLKTSLFLLCV